MRYEALGSHLIVRMAPPKSEIPFGDEGKKLYLPDNAKQSVPMAVILSVGPDVQQKEQLVPGALVAISIYAGFPLTDQNDAENDIRAIGEKDLLARVFDD